MAADNPRIEPVAPLAGLRVVDFSRLLPGAFCSLLLSDLGADVVKVEHPRGGDGLRLAPPFAATGESGAHIVLDRGKRSVAADLKTDDGLTLARSLVAGADVVIESFRPGTFDRLGLGWTWLAEHHPRVVLASLSAYGAGGSDAGRSGHDLNALAVAGALSLTHPPATPGGQAADVLAGALAAVGILAALRERDRTGRGRQVDVGLADAASATVVLASAERLASGQAPQAGGPLSGGLACYGTYECADRRWVAVGALEPVLFARLCESLGEPDLVAQQYDIGRQDRLRHRLAAAFARRPRDACVEHFAGVDAAVSPVLDVAEAALRAEHAGRAVVAGRLSDGTPVSTPGGFVRVVGAPAPPSSAAPGLGTDARSD